MLLVLDLADADRQPAAFRDQLREAAHDCGFFHLVGHGVAAVQMAEVLALARAFFALPVHVKNEISQLKSPQFRGYSRLGGERLEITARSHPDVAELHHGIPLKGRATVFVQVTSRSENRHNDAPTERLPATRHPSRVCK
jgi:isopenicillin N synthase-like dioxygenase